MTRVRTTLHNIIGGVSQQPESTRLESQCEVQDNGYSSIVDGMMKRQPTELIRHLDEIVQLGISNPEVHWINRDSTERYLVVFDAALPDKIAVFDATDGTKMTVSGPGGVALTSASKTYLTNNSAGQNIQALTVADTTFILNRDITCAMDPLVINDAVDVDTGGPVDNRSASHRRLFYFVRSTGPLRRYGVRFWTTLEDGSHDPFVDNQGELNANVAALTLHDGTFGENRNGSKRHSPPYDPTAGLEEGWQLNTFDPAEVARGLYVAGKRVGGATTYLGAIRSRWVDQNRFATDIRDILNFNSINSDMPQVGSVVMMELKQTNKVSTFFRKELDLEMVKEGGEGSLVIFKDVIETFSDLPLFCQEGHIVKVQNDPASDEGVFYVKFTRDAADSPPATVAFDLGKGTWEESAASLKETTIDPFTMPLKMTRELAPAEPKGFRFEITFINWDACGAGDDNSNPQPSFIGKELQYLFFWKNRLGFLTQSRFIMSEADEFFNFWRTTVATLPDSDPIDVDVGHIKVNKLRSAIPLEDALILFSDRTQFVVRGEPLLSPKTVAVSVVTDYQSYADLVPVATDHGIFFGYPSGTPPFSKIREFKRVEDGNTFRAFEASAQIPRYIKGVITDLAAQGSEQVLVAISNDVDNRNVLWIYKFFDSGTDRILSAWQRYTLGPAATTFIYGIEFVENDLMVFLRRNNTFFQTQIQYHMEKIVFSDSRQDSFPHSVDDPEAGGSATSDYLTLLDHRLTENECVLTYDETTETVNIQLPYQVQANSAGDAVVEMKVITRINSNDAGGMGDTASQEGIEWPIDSQFVTNNVAGNKTTLRIKDQDKTKWVSLGSPTLAAQSKDDRLTRLWIGQTYEMVYEFTRQTLRERTTSGGLGDVKTGRYQLIMGTVAYENTGHFQVEVASALHADGSSKLVDRSTFVYNVNPMTVGVGGSLLGNPNIRSDIIRFPIRSQPANVRIRLLNASPLPSQIKSASWEAEYTAKATAWRV